MPLNRSINFLLVFVGLCGAQAQAFEPAPAVVINPKEAVEALIQNPVDMTGKDALRSLAGDPRYSKSKYEIDRFLELLDYSELLKRRVGELEENAQSAFQRLPGSLGEDAIKKVNDLRGELFGVEPAPERISSTLTDLLKKEPVDFAGLNRAYWEYKNKLFSRMLQLQSLLEHFKEPPKVVKMKVIEVPKVEQPPQAAPGENFKKRLAQMSMNLYEKDTQIADKDGRITELGNQLKEVEERLALIQRIMQEKDSQIQKFQVQVNQVNQGEEDDNKINQFELKTLQDKLAQFESTFAAQTASQKSEMNSLRAQVEKQEATIAKYEGELLRRREEIVKLKTDVFYKDKQKTELDQVLASKDDKLLELKGMLEIYQFKLRDVHYGLIEKNQEVETLKQQLQELKHELTQARQQKDLKERIDYISNVYNGFYERNGE